MLSAPQIFAANANRLNSPFKLVVCFLLAGAPLITAAVASEEVVSIEQPIGEATGTGKSTEEQSTPLFESIVGRIDTFIKSKKYPKKCLALPSKSLPSESVSKKNLQRWLDEKVNYVDGVEYLELKQENSQNYLRQTLIPADNGSPRVGINANLELHTHSTYRISQQVFLEPGFDWGRKFQGGKIGFGLGGGSSPSGGQLKKDGFTARFIWRGNGDGTARMAVYSYAADRSQKLPYGDDHPLDGFDVPVGEWFNLMMEVTVNSDLETADGELKAWANGEKLLDLKNIHWQSEGEEPGIQKLIYSTFYGGGTIDWAPLQTTYIRFSDVCWAPVVEGYSALSPKGNSRNE